MAHTTYCVELPSTSGHRLVQQVGSFTFPTAAAKTARITVGFHKFVAGTLTPAEQVVAKTSTIHALPFFAASQITQCLDRIVTVQRLTAGAFKTGTLMYSLYGY
ncbi:MAG: hypothetical protein M0R06_07955 [Sphaerochaeta sp.]|nr:hypothetical protein [Sphaerochaeta sp.]